jgi:hypothetical protein
VFEDVPMSPPGVISLSSNHHGSLMPEHQAASQKELAETPRAKDRATESGWWGALANIIDRPQIAYDPSNKI